MSLKTAIVYILLIILRQTSYGQDALVINYQNEPLNDVLLDLNTRFQIPISIDARVSSGCNITLNQTFESIESVMESISSICDLQMNLINGVYSFKS